MSSTLIKFLTCLVILVVLRPAMAADHDLISLFPIEHYDQTLSHWIKPTDNPLLSTTQQNTLMEELYRHYYSADPKALSPWSPDYINKIFSLDLYSGIMGVLDKFDNQNKPADQIGYGANFRPYSSQWIEQIRNNVYAEQFRNPKKYNPHNRAIAVDNLMGRDLPTDDPHFYDHSLPGQGYPFDNLQGSVVWAGTPLYIMSESQDHAWDLVLTPDYYLAWVKSSGVAKVNNAFVKTFSEKAKIQLAGIAKNNLSILDEHHNYRFSGYIGMIFPVANKDATPIKILIPVKDEKGYAQIHEAVADVNLLPLSATPHHFSDIIQQNINRSYGWGNMYYLNDCSAETKNLLINFGIWVPRHSTYQVDPQKVMGQFINLSPEALETRIVITNQSAHPLLSIIYIGHHVMLYVGNNAVYENMWGFSPKDNPSRVVIGQAVFLPLAKSFPENPQFVSQAGHEIYQVMNLDVLPKDIQAFRDLEFNNVDMHALMSP